MGLEKLHLVVGLVFLATIVHIIAFATPGWLTDEDSNIGLWSGCTKTSVRVCGNLPTGTSDSKFEAVRAMECLALIAFVVSSGSAFLLFLTKNDSYRPLMAATAIAGASVAADVIYDVDWVTKELSNKPIPITGPVEPKYESPYGMFRHWSSRKYVHLASAPVCPGDAHNLVVHSGYHTDGRMSFKFEQVIGHYGYFRHTCGQVIQPEGGFINPGDNTPLVVHSGEHSACLFTMYQDRIELIHRSGKLAHPSGGSSLPGDNTNVVLHIGSSDPAKFEFVDPSSFQVINLFPDPLLHGVWKIIYAVIDPLGDHEYTIRYNVGQSISKQASQGYEWKVSAEISLGWFANSAQYGQYASRTETVTWEAEIERIMTIKVPAGQTVVTWQYFFEADQFGDGLLFRSTILADTDDVTKPPDV